MSDTPGTDEQINGKPCTRFECLVQDSLRDALVPSQFARQLERELNAANERIKSLIEERDRANRLADWKWNLRGEFESLLGTDKIEEGIEAVKELKRRIKQLEEAGDALFELCDASPIQFELVDQIPQRLKAWEEAKEDKP